MQTENFATNGNGKHADPVMGQADLTDSIPETAENEYDYSQYQKKEKDNAGLFTLLFYWLKTRSYRFWAIALIVTLIGGFTSAVFYVLNNKPDKTALGTDRENSMTLSQVSPAMLGGITPDTPREEVIPRLQDGTILYEGILNAVTSDTFKQMYSNRASQLYELATKEELSGKFNPKNPYGVIDLSKCPQNVGRIRVCVLMRYALEGLNDYRNGLESNDLDLTTKGYNKFYPSILALHQPESKVVEYTRPLDGATEYTKAIYQLVQVIPPNSFKEPFGLKINTPQSGNMTAAKKNKVQNKSVAVPKANK